MQGMLNAIALQALQAKPTLWRDCAPPAGEFARGNLGEESCVNPSPEEPAPNRIARIACGVAPRTEIERDPERPVVRDAVTDCQNPPRSTRRSPL
jgi:hypothetical protein